MARTKRQPDGAPSIPAAVRPAHDAVVGRIEAFCRAHLNEEYEALCRKPAGVLARKWPSPLTRGKPESWTSGIVRVILCPDPGVRNLPPGSNSGKNGRIPSEKLVNGLPCQDTRR